MDLSKKDLEKLNKQSVKIKDAKLFADFISEDNTVGGVFPEGNLDQPDTVKFKTKWCKIWKFAKPVLNLAKIFTNDKADKVIDTLLVLGNQNCKK